MGNKRLYLVDGSGYIFRAYHALPPLTRKRDGMPVGAVRGFCAMLFKLMQEAQAEGDGLHMAIVFDAEGPSFRKDIYPQYKAHRPPAPEDLVPQFALTREAVAAFGVVGMERSGFEADDIIATYALRGREAGMETVIVSSDKDLMQLVGEGICMLDAMKERRIGRAEVAEKFGVPPEQLLDLLALAGDSSDNIPGVPGIGVKTAAQLLGEYGDLESLLARAGEIKQNKRRESLIAYAEQARLSKRLATLECAVPMEVSLGALLLEPPDASRLIGFLKDMEFATLTRRIAAAWDMDANAIPAAGRVVAQAVAESAAVASSVSSGEAGQGREQGEKGWVADGLAEGFASALESYALVRDVAALEAWIARAREAGVVAVDTETDSLDPMRAALVGVALAVAPGEACYIPLRHVSAAQGEGELALGEAAAVLVEGQIPQEEALALLRPLLEDASVLKVGQNIKFDLLVFRNHGIRLVGWEDSMLLSYVLDAGRGSHGMDELARRHLGHEPIPFKEVAGSGRKQVTFDKVGLEEACRYGGEDADVTLRLFHCLKPRLLREGQCALYETLERPMPGVLAEMERCGIMVDRELLAEISAEFAAELCGMEGEIHALAGRAFNINSPKQLGEILFREMGLEGERKTKSGFWATGARELERLAGEGHELPRRVLAWRHLAKLKNTYADTLPNFIHPESGRVHTSFALASTTTGRLSSSDPNLQNIPVRSKEGRRIRAAFIAAPGCVLVSADYSQIELRVLAHIAGIESLQKAFANGQDIHAMTASEMFGVPLEEMDAMTRYRAKAINFGIIYGISAHGLANQLGIGRSEAAEYIDAYFRRFPGIRDYMEERKRFCRQHGYVETLFGRRAHYPDIKSGSPQQRAFMERAAINAPIQGTAADIIRRAMIRLPEALRAASLSARMLLQVHDELIFETPEGEAEAVCALAKEVMAGAAAPAADLKVALEVEAKFAQNWEQAH